MLVPPLMWAGNAIVGRLMNNQVPPMTLNLLRWVVAGILLAPLGYRVLQKGGLVHAARTRLALLGLLGMFSYNSFQYLALTSSTPINATLVASIMPFWMLLAGRVVFGVSVRRQAIVATVFTLAGVMLVLSRGDWQKLLSIELVPGDAWMLLATLGWTGYSWLLARPTPAQAELNVHWAEFLWIQILFGVAWSALAAGAEWWLFPALGGEVPHMGWDWGVAAALLYVGVAPALIAYRCWGIGVAQAGPGVAVFFASLTPVFAAVMSSLVLRYSPHWYHYVAFALILLGIWVSSRPQRSV
jgi:drug/metabolite transporter (DMT)-like permease